MIHSSAPELLLEAWVHGSSAQVPDTAAQRSASCLLKWASDVIADPHMPTSQLLAEKSEFGEEQSPMWPIADHAQASAGMQTGLPL